MKIKITRADERLQLGIEFPGGEEFRIWLSREQTLKQLNIADDA